jgi:hypothetical protein
VSVGEQRGLRPIYPHKLKNRVTVLLLCWCSVSRQQVVLFQKALRSFSGSPQSLTPCVDYSIKEKLFFCLHTHQGYLQLSLALLANRTTKKYLNAPHNNDNNSDLYLWAQ